MVTKKYIKWLIIPIIILGLTGCPWDKKSSKESRELLEKILQIIGIPYDIIVNVCQDENNNGFCEKIELQSKLTISVTKGELFWQKIEQSGEGLYLLQTYDYTKPILLELQDINRVNFNNGKFTIYFSGFESNKQKEKKELSVLQAMIDAKHLQVDDVKGLRDLGNPYAQDKFYEYLFEGLEENLNRLGENGFAPHEAISIDIEKMAKKLIENNITTDLPARIKECTNNECIDKELEVLSTLLAIDDTEMTTDEEEVITR